MSVHGLADLVLQDKVLAEAMEDARQGAVPALDLTGPSALRPFVVRGLVDAGRTVLAVAATAREAEDLVEALGSLMDPSLVGYYPSWETLPHERLSPRSDTVGRRLAVLRRLVDTLTDEKVKRLRQHPETTRASSRRQVMSQVDMAYDILMRARAPLHVSEIIARIQQIFGVSVDRESLVSSLTKKVARSDRFTRTEKNTFGLLAVTQ